MISFAPFRLDTRDERLYRDDEVIVLRPKSLAVLRYLAEHPDRLVTKQELLDAVWPETSVSDTVLKVCVREVREALGDDRKPWRYIETAHRRGYRFIGRLTGGGQTLLPVPGATGRSACPPLVGRARELARLDAALAKAVAGERQVVFVTGEPGIGKTALVDVFVERAGVRIARGQCLEHYGASEAYMPVLDALGRLCNAPGGERVVAALRKHAPMWLAQLPGLIGIDERERLLQEITGSSRERMLREMSHAIEVLTADMPLVLVLEDLHWSDGSTVNLLSALAAQRTPARLMIIGTYRPADVVAADHPLKAAKQEMQLHARCIELALGFLDDAAVAEYLTRRFGSAPRDVAQWIRRRTEGNPLFMINIIDYLGGEASRVEQAMELDERLVPDNIRHMIEKQIERLASDAQRTLEAASVAGITFAAATVAAALQDDVLRVEELCEVLARRNQFLRGAEDGRYRFIHALYQNALYERVPAGRRAQLHQRIGEREERAWGDRAGEIAAELAMHFEQAGDHPRAAHHLQLAAENATRRFADREAVALAQRGLALLMSLPESPERARQELLLQATLALPLAATHGYAAAVVASTYSRARALCQELGDDVQLFPILAGLTRFSIIRAELHAARELGEQLLRVAERHADPVLLLEAHWTLGVTFVNLGLFAEADRHLESAVSFYRAEDLGTYLKHYAHDPRAVCRCFHAWALWSLGREKRALAESRAALAFARETNHPETLAFALFFAAWLQQLRRDSAKTLEYTTALVAHAAERGLVQWSAFAMSLHGWALAMEGQLAEGIEQMRAALAGYRAIGSEISRPHFLGLLAEALALDGQIDEALAALDEALVAVEKTGERYYEPELRRLRDELLQRRMRNR